MGYVSAEQGTGLVASATKGLMVYAVITIPLVLVTMGTYLLFEHFNRRSRFRTEKIMPEKSLCMA